MDQYGAFPFGKDGADTGHLKHSPVRAGYCSLFDTEPASGKVRMRPDYDYYAFSGKPTISYQIRKEFEKL